MQSGFDFGDIIDEVIARALGETSTAADVISAKRSIYMVLEDWHAQQFNTWRVKTLTFGTSPDTPQVRLPANIDDVLSVTTRNTSQPLGSETPLTRMSETEYANLSTKNTRGQPTQFMLRRTEPPVIFLNPVGRVGQTEIITVTYIARPDQYDRFGGEVDAPARWQNALIIGSALDLATKNPARAGERLNYLPGMYDRALKLALTNDRDRTSFRMRIG